MAGSSTKSASSTKRKAAADDGKVTLTLAHPIAPPYHVGLGLEAKDEDYKVDEEIAVWPHVARAIINAGYAQVDPENPKEVAEALNISDEAAEALVSEMAGGVGQAPDAGAPAT